MNPYTEPPTPGQLKHLAGIGVTDPPETKAKAQAIITGRARPTSKRGRAERERRRIVPPQSAATRYDDDRQRGERRQRGEATETEAWADDLLASIRGE